MKHAFNLGCVLSFPAQSKTAFEHFTHQCKFHQETKQSLHRAQNTLHHAKNTKSANGQNHLIFSYKELGTAYLHTAHINIYYCILQRIIGIFRKLTTNFDILHCNEKVSGVTGAFASRSLVHVVIVALISEIF